MRKVQTLLYTIAVVAIALSYSGCNQAPSDITDPIKEANKKMMEAFANGDTSALLDFYLTDAKIFPANNEVIDGKDAIGKFWTATRQMGIAKVLFETTTAQKFGNIAIEEGKYSLFVPNDIMVDQGKYIVTWKKENSTWKVYRDIWNNSSTAPVKRASDGDSVMIVLNYVKPDKAEQFENFNMNILSPAGAETNPQVKATVRMQKPVRKNADGTYTYVYLMDPFKGSLNYDIYYSLSAKYGKEKADEYMKMYLDCLVGGNSKAMLLTETNW